MTVAEPQLENSPLLELLGGFIIELREAGLPVSLTENLDAMEAVTHIPLEDRESFKYALGATLVKNHTHWKGSCWNSMYQMLDSGSETRNRTNAHTENG